MSLIDKNKIITEKDFETVKARLLLGDYLMAHVATTASFILFRLLPEDKEIPTDSWKVDLIDELIFPKHIETIKTYLSLYHSYKKMIISNYAYKINMTQFLELWEKTIK